MTAVLLVFAASQPASAGGSEDAGTAAYQRGDYIAAYALWQKLARQGDARAQLNLGQMYEKGRGVQRDDSEAFKWYQKAAAQGNADAQYRLGWMYDNGRGVPWSYNEALAWYEKAADQGQPEAQRDFEHLMRKMSKF
ncbi:MAG: tetratricopeptide repeat protein [Burkholderiales bacterium]